MHNHLLSHFIALCDLLSVLRFKYLSILRIFKVLVGVILEGNFEEDTSVFMILDYWGSLSLVALCATNNPRYFKPSFTNCVLPLLLENCQYFYASICLFISLLGKLHIGLVWEVSYLELNGLQPISSTRPVYYEDHQNSTLQSEWSSEEAY